MRRTLNLQIFVEAGLGFLAAIGAYRLVIGSAADPTKWQSTMEYYGVPQDISWGFPLLAAAIQMLMTWSAWHLLAYLVGTPRFFSIPGIGRAGWVGAALLPALLALFILFRPPNFSVAMVFLSCGIAFVLSASVRFSGLAILTMAGHRSLSVEAKATPRTVNLLLVMASLLIGLAMAEGALRIYNPFALRIRGDKIVLPTLTREVVHNNTPGKMEAVTVHTKNSLGFRGQEPPADLADRVSVIAVGGSTTEDAFLSDESTWPAIMEKRLKAHIPLLWVNNAGFAGHSTTAHALLLDDYLAPLKPKFILFLVGINDLAKDSLMPIASMIVRYESTLSGKAVEVRPMLDRIANWSELANLANILRRRLAAAQAGLQPFTLSRTGEIHVPGRRAGSAEDEALLRARLAGAREGYRRRLQGLIERSREMGALPILVTQPLLWGDERDPDTGMDLASVAEEIAGVSTSSATLWRLLEDYNDVARGLSATTNVDVIDLAATLPKRSAFYYDKMHFSPEGARAVGTIVAMRLCRIIERTMGKEEFASCPPDDT